MTEQQVATGLTTSRNAVDDNELFDKWLAENTPRDRAYSLTDLRHGFMAALALQRKEFTPYSLRVSTAHDEAVLVRALLSFMHATERGSREWIAADELREAIVSGANDDGRFEFKL